VRRSGGYGVAVAEDASCELSDSDLSETGAAAVRVTGSGRLTVARTALQRAGVSIDTDCALTLVDCSISAVAGSGVDARDTARLDLLRTKVEDCTAAGIALEGGVQARLRECVIRSNGTDGIVVATTGAVHISDTAVVDNAGWGIARRQPAGELVTDAVASRGNGAEHGDGAVAAPRMPSGGAPRDPADELRAELARLVGLDSVKSEVSDLADLIQISKQREAFGLPAPPISRHMVFSGPPGTGKTSVARLYGRLLAALGVLPRGHVVEVSRVDLVAQVVGGTAIKTTERFQEALGGVFFIDEAYSLAAREAGLGPDFGREAIDTVVKLMEDHRDQVVVIAAGYTVPMQAFVASNPGLASRISRTIEFPAYSVDELVTIVDGICEQHRYRIADEARVALAEHFARARQQDNFGNARAARQIFESMVAAQARRLARRPGLHAQDLASLVAADVPAPAPMVQAAQVVPLRAPRKSGAAAEAVASR
jgi:Holliday junction resolvasome RuvABC ATP-dependent DNA helicase subunit